MAGFIMVNNFDFTPASHYFTFNPISIHRTGLGIKMPPPPIIFTFPKKAAYTEWPPRGGVQTHDHWLAYYAGGIHGVCRRVLDRAPKEFGRYLHVQSIDLGCERAFIHPLMIAELIDTIAMDLAQQIGVELKEHVRSIKTLDAPNGLDVHWQLEDGLGKYEERIGTAARIVASMYDVIKVGHRASHSLAS